MALTLDTVLNMSLNATHTSTDTLSNAVDTLLWPEGGFTDRLTSGTGLDNADRIYHARPTAAASADSFDLTAVLLDVFGNAITFTKIKGIIIRNRSAVAGETLAVGGNANALVNWVANATDIVNVGPDSLFILWNPSLAGYGVTATTGDILDVDPGAATIIYDIVLIGTSA